MEDVLDLYAEPLDPNRPVVCFDEKPLQVLEETRVSRPVAPAQPALMDHEYRRKGTANIFMAVEPRSWRFTIDNGGAKLKHLYPAQP